MLAVFPSSDRRICQSITFLRQACLLEALLIDRCLVDLFVVKALMIVEDLRRMDVLSIRERLLRNLTSELILV